MLQGDTPMWDAECLIIKPENGSETRPNSLSGRGRMTSSVTDVKGAHQPNWSTRASVFFDHWQSLRSGNDMPTSEAFLDNPNPRIQANAFIFELASETRTVFRLVGTEIVMIWGKDFTKLSVEEAFTADLAATYLADPRACIPNACGLWEQGIFGDTRGREVILELMYVPLKVQSERPARLGGFLNWHGTSDTAASRMGLIALTRRHWIDIGAGIPTNPPKVFKV